MNAEVWCVLPAIRVSCIHQSQNEVLSIRISLQYFLKCLHSFIPLACAECNDSLPLSWASSIPLCYVLFPATLLHQLFFHPLSPHLTIHFLVYLSILFFPNSYIIPFCIFNSISLAGMRIFVLCEGCVTQIPVQYFRNQRTNQPGPWFVQICNERASNQAKIKIGYLLKLNLSTVTTLTLVLNSSPDIQTKIYLAIVQLLLFTSAPSTDPCISNLGIISIHFFTENSLQHTCTHINRRNESAYMMLKIILNNPWQCTELLDLLTKPTNIHKRIKVSVVISNHNNTTSETLQVHLLTHLTFFGHSIQPSSGRKYRCINGRACYAKF